MKTAADIDLIEKALEKSNLKEIFLPDYFQYMRLVRYEKGEQMIDSSVPLDDLIFLLEGTAKLYSVHKNGKQSLISFFEPVCIIGDTELFYPDKMPYPLFAQTQCRALLVNTESCRERLLSDTVFLRNVYSMSIKRVTLQNRRYINLVSYPVVNSFAECLLTLQSDDIFSEKLTEIADYLSISYRHLMHLISNLVDAGYLERCDEGLKIKDYDALRKLENELTRTSDS